MGPIILHIPYKAYSFFIKLLNRTYPNLALKGPAEVKKKKKKKERRGSDLVYSIRSVEKCVFFCCFFLRLFHQCH